jgi:Trypsin
MRFWVIRAAMLALFSAIAAVPLRAITYGFIDTTNAFPNAGAFLVKSPASGQIFPICSGTLIGTDVFLTASHCTAYFEQELARSSDPVAGGHPRGNQQGQPPCDVLPGNRHQQHDAESGNGTAAGSLDEQALRECGIVGEIKQTAAGPQRKRGREQHNQGRNQ